ncbi:MAG: dTDP-glucose 4,6 dehydratase [Euryarchaeota archaeon ADurb.Bin294]|jgi:nucleoside-diphosphate-sugar epimerase|nr:MAG: dTDP-glucose 4,6 dehydratase [Euryarchaeota archaeon ADurb.Bin294]
MKTVLVTGATGFIGRHVLEPLVRKGFDVHCVYRTKRPETIFDGGAATWHQVDLLNGNEVKNLFDSFSPAYLLHLAWDVTPGSYLESVNNFSWLDFSLHLLREFAESGGTRAVCAGTCIEYDVRYGYCIEYLTPTVPSTYYGICKHQLQSIGEKYADKMGFDFAWGRIFQPYGPYEYPARLVPSVIRSLLNDEPARCTHGNQVRDFLYVADVADAFVALLDSEVTGIVNIGSGEPVSIKELVMQIAHLLGKEDDILFGALPARENEPPFIVADTGRLKKEVQWHQRYPLEKGIMETVSWWKKMGIQE